MDRAVAIANEFLQRPDGRGLTQMQLQKLVYISHGWCLAITGQPLTIEMPQAWDYGPVYPELYDHTKYFGKSAIGRPITPDDERAARFFGSEKRSTPPYRAQLDATERQIVEYVWQRYGGLSGGRLSALTHQPGTPWSQTFDDGRGKNDEIGNDLIRAHYRAMAERANAPA